MSTNYLCHLSVAIAESFRLHLHNTVSSSLVLVGALSEIALVAVDIGYGFNYLLLSFDHENSS